MSDYQLVEQQQLQVAPQTKLANASVEYCAELCSLEDSYLCRSFDYFIETNECQLYKENVKDGKFNASIVAAYNQKTNHYSSKIKFKFAKIMESEMFFCL